MVCLTNIGFLPSIISMKKKTRTIIIILSVLLLFIVYLLAGAFISANRHEDVSDTIKDSFDPDSVYANDTGPERVLSLDDNTEALTWRIRAIEAAKEEIVFTSFDLRDDDSGGVLLAALYGAADRGVHIQILVDGFMGGLYLNNDDFHALIALPNVEAKFYNSIHILKPWKFTFRMHDKYVIIDDTMYILGGRNSTNAGLADGDIRHNEDRDIFVYETDPENTDTSITQLKAYFTSMWAQPDCVEETCTENEKTKAAGEELMDLYASLPDLYPEAYTEIDYEDVSLPTNKITLLNNTQEAAVREPVLWYELCQLMMDKKDVIIESPYVVLSQAMYEQLTRICQSTDKVTLITNALESGNNLFGNADYLNERGNVLECGVTIYEYMGENYCHTKTILVDDRLSIVGSYNFDMRSTYQDTEMMLAIDSRELNADLRSIVEKQEARSRRVNEDGTTTPMPDYAAQPWPWYKRLGYTLMRVVIVPFRCFA